MDENPDGATDLGHRLSRGDSPSAEKLFPLVYDQLRDMADAYLRRERRAHNYDVVLQIQMISSRTRSRC